jgi:hypothetical protein
LIFPRRSFLAIDKRIDTKYTVNALEFQLKIDPDLRLISAVFCHAPFLVHSELSRRYMTGSRLRLACA